MYAVEIIFTDTDESQNLFVKRPVFTIGAREENHVFIKDFETLDFELHILQEGANNFRCKQVSTLADQAPESSLDNSYQGLAKFNIGNVKLVINSIDNDLKFKPNETPDIAGIRILREGINSKLNTYPAFKVEGYNPFLVSFNPSQEVYAGRSNECLLRFDARDVSSIHAKFGLTNNKFWVEDLGSTNGTYLNGTQVSGRVEFDEGTTILLGGSIKIQGVLGEASEKLTSEATESQTVAPEASEVKAKFPVILSLSEVARPAKLVLTEDKWISIGRDPNSEFWVGAPYVSRVHCKLKLHFDGKVEIKDTSTNGTAYLSGILKDGASIFIDNKPEILHFGSGLTVALCFNSEEEDKFFESQGSPNAFIDSESDKELISELTEEVGADVLATTRGNVLDTVMDFNSDNAIMKENSGIGYYMSIFSSLSPIKKLLLVLLFLLLVSLFVAVLSIIWAILD